MRCANRHLAPALFALLALIDAGVASQPAASNTGFAAEIASLSEPEGAFDTDNLISNERNYLQVVPALISKGVAGGVYIGVGPDQNFSYIARIRPALAYIIDIRRDNLLLHLLFKALFARSTTRVEYLCLLTGRPPPGDLARWRTAPIAQVVAFVDAQRPEPARQVHLRKQLRSAIVEFGVPLSAGDLETVDRFHSAFTGAGLDLRFNTHGRAPRPYYPTLRELLLGTDGTGTTWNYLAEEGAFQFLKSLQARNRVIPVVGDVSGTHAMRAIAASIARQGRRVSAFYVSNVETYLYSERAARFAENVRRLPHDARSVIIRSRFSPDGGSTSVLAPFFEEEGERR